MQLKHKNINTLLHFKSKNQNWFNTESRVNKIGKHKTETEIKGL